MIPDEKRTFSGTCVWPLLFRPGTRRRDPELLEVPSHVQDQIRGPAERESTGQRYFTGDAEREHGVAGTDLPLSKVESAGRRRVSAGWVNDEVARSRRVRHRQIRRNRRGVGGDSTASRNYKRAGGERSEGGPSERPIRITRIKNAAGRHRVEGTGRVLTSEKDVIEIGIPGKPGAGADKK